MATDEKWEKLKEEFYGQNRLVITDYGTIDFSPDSLKEVQLNGQKITYDEYLEIQRNSNERGAFAECYYSGGEQADCKGQILKIEDNKIMFKRIYVSGMYMDGDGFEGKEDHVWMSRKGFEKYKVGDCLSFSAEVYRYLKKNKQIDFGLRKPDFIEKIDSYQLPSDEELLMQDIDRIICETCLFTDHCDRVYCLASSEEVENKRQFLLAQAKQVKSK